METAISLAFTLGYPELIIFAGILLLLFGSAKLPSLMRNMGRSVNEFKAGIKEKPQDAPDSVDDDGEQPGNIEGRLNEEQPEQISS